MSRAARATRLVPVLLFVELLDELAGGVIGASLPHLRTDLDLTYGQIGALFAVPAVLGNLFEVPLGVLSDRGHRRRLILGGGVAFTVALATMASAPGYAVLLAAFVAYYPASGAFVSLSQAVLVDVEPERAEPLMARWTLAGSVGVVVGPLLFAAVLVGGGGWRLALGLVVILFVVGVGAAALVPIPEVVGQDRDDASTAGDLWSALRRRAVLVAVALLQLSDLLQDVLGAFLALYLVDVAGLGGGTAALGLALWAAAGLVGDALAVPLLDRCEGRAIVRVTAMVAAALYAGMLLADSTALTLALVALLGAVTAGWYPVLQARLYATLPGRSGVAVSVASLGGIAGGVLPLALGLLAQAVGLGPTMWLLLLGPVALVVGLRPTGRGRPSRRPSGPGGR